jgi:hypothetical protein
MSPQEVIRPPQDVIRAIRSAPGRSRAGWMTRDGCHSLFRGLETVTCQGTHGGVTDYHRAPAAGAMTGLSEITPGVCCPALRLCLTLTRSRAIRPRRRVRWPSWPAPLSLTEEESHWYCCQNPLQRSVPDEGHATYIPDLGHLQCRFAVLPTERDGSDSPPTEDIVRSVNADRPCRSGPHPRCPLCCGVLHSRRSVHFTGVSVRVVVKTPGVINSIGLCCSSDPARS